jgi:hypothetical protein
MKNIDSKKIMNDLKQKANKDLEKQLIQEIKSKFPDIKNYSVRVDISTGKINITGLTKEQASQLSKS